MEEQERPNEQPAGAPGDPAKPALSEVEGSPTGGSGEREKPVWEGLAVAEGAAVASGRPASESEASELDAETPDLDLIAGEPEIAVGEDEDEEEPSIDIRAILRQARETVAVEDAPREEPEPSPAAPSDERAWFVIHCYSGYEKKVKHNLEQRIDTMAMADQIFQVVVPTEEEIEVKEGKRRTVERRVFPGYILVQMLMNDDSWYVVRNTPGVTGFVGMGNKPTPLRQEEVANILKRMEAEAPKVKVTFKPGQKVRIIDGPFNDFLGVVDEIDMDKAKARVMVSFFGRDTPVELDFLQVEKV